MFSFFVVPDDEILRYTEVKPHPTPPKVVEQIINAIEGVEYTYGEKFICFKDVLFSNILSLNMKNKYIYKK